MRAPLFIGAGVVAIALAWWRGRGVDELGDELGELAPALEDLAGVTPQASELYAIALEANVAAGLAAVRYGEGTADPEGYYRLFGGDLVAHLADHPRRYVTRVVNIRDDQGNVTPTPITSSAAGAYQILERTWNDVQRALELPDFSTTSQDIAAVYLIRRRGALELLRAGRLEAALAKMAREWASLPGSPYGQPRKSLQQIARVYTSAGGTLA
jgi:lysozyme